MLPARLGIAGAILVVVLILLGVCWKAGAQEVDYPPGEDQIVPLSAGERAPFEGQLFSTDTAIRWGFRLQRLRLRLEQDVLREREICAAQTDLLETKMRLSAENTAFQLQTLRDQLALEHQRVLDLEESLAAASETPWYKTWSFGLLVGTVITGALVALSGWLIHDFA